MARFQDGVAGKAGGVVDVEADIVADVVWEEFGEGGRGAEVEAEFGQLGTEAFGGDAVDLVERETGGGRAERDRRALDGQDSLVEVALGEEKRPLTGHVRVISVM